MVSNSGSTGPGRDTMNVSESLDDEKECPKKKA